MNSLILAPKFAPHKGGTAMVWTNWCRWWPADQIEVVCPVVPGAADYDAEAPFPVHRVSYPGIPKLRMPWLWAKLGLKGWQRVRRRQFDVVHCAHVLETGWVGPLLGRPYLVHTYGEELTLYERNPLTRRLIRRILAGTSGVTTISRYSAELLGRFGYRGPLLMVHPAVDSERFQFRPRASRDNGTVLLTVARLMPRKGHDLVLEVLPRLLPDFPGLRYRIAGIGPDEARLRELVRARGLEGSVEFLGKVPDAELPDLFRSADIFVHPNRELPAGDVEGFGIVFLEASACGIPVVGGNSGGTPDAVEDGVSGILVDPRSPGQLEAQLRRLLVDPDLRRRMGEAGPAWAARFSWRAAAESVWEFTREVLR